VGDDLLLARSLRGMERVRLVDQHLAVGVPITALVSDDERHAALHVAVTSA